MLSMVLVQVWVVVEMVVRGETLGRGPFLQDMSILIEVNTLQA